MSTDLKRFTVSITPDLELELDEVRKEMFYNSNQSVMVRYLIKLGLAALRQERELKESAS